MRTVDPLAELGGAAARWSSLVVCALVSGLACGQPRPLPPPPAPALAFDAHQAALAVEHATQLSGAFRIVFDWTLLDGPARFRGRGVARIEGPDRARIDLFSTGGETVARAVVIRDEVWLPPSALALPVPPPSLFWATLGVFRPDRSAALQGGERRSDGEIRLQYLVADDGTMLEGGVDGRSLRWLERQERGRSVERVELTPAAESRFPRRATYRDLRAYRELTLELRTIENVDSYPPDIWDLGR
ncbi:MAG: hypothetical protein HY701_01185 [Gemmatimonadetes bacterium]|nr:hypothetical protein [Gemmatimonadota bacterium]